MNFIQAKKPSSSFQKSKNVPLLLKCIIISPHLDLLEFADMSYGTYLGLPCGSAVKKSISSAGDAGATEYIPGSGRSPGEGNGNLLQDSCLESPMDRLGLLDHSPWGCQESDVTE